MPRIAKGATAATSGVARGAAPGGGRRSGRPSAPVISRREAVEAALRIIDEEGLGELSMRRLGRELDVTGPSLYYHFDDKDEILQEVVRYMLRRVVAVPAQKAWQEYVLLASAAYRDALLEHPNAAPLFVSRSWRTYSHAVMDQNVRTMLAAGVPAHLPLVLFRAMEMLAFATVLFDKHTDNSGFGDVDEQYEALREAISDDSWTPEQQFEMTMKAIVTGFAASITFDASPSTS